MKRKKPTKKRSDWVTAVINNTTGRISWTIDPTTNSIRFNEVVPGTEKIVRSYERESGKEKVVMELPISKGSPSFDQFHSIGSNFDHLLAIDTNTLQIDRTWVSATIAYVVPFPVASYKGELEFVYLDGCVKARAERENHDEEFGWHWILSRRVNPSRFSGGATLGVIVDSRLGDIPAINKGDAPYFLDHFLPNFAKLIYASADASMSDGLPNQMIRYCDQAARAVLREIAAGKTKIPESAFRSAAQIGLGLR